LFHFVSFSFIFVSFCFVLPGEAQLARPRNWARGDDPIPSHQAAEPPDPENKKYKYKYLTFLRNFILRLVRNLKANHCLPMRLGNYNLVSPERYTSHGLLSLFFIRDLYYRSYYRSLL
jgi:hypothetical protein